MKILLLLIIICSIIKVYCSSHNQFPTSLVTLIFAVSDENCIHKKECGPRTDDNGNFVKFKIGEDNEHNAIEGTIKDLIPELRKLSDGDAKVYFEKVLFPSVKKAINEYFNIKDYNTLDDMTQEQIINKLTDVMNEEDVITKLLIKGSNSISFVNDNIEKSYSYFGVYEKSINEEFIKFVTDNNKKSLDIKNFYNNDNPLNPNIPIGVWEQIAEECRGRVTCKKYFKDKNKNSIGVSVIESIDENTKKHNYHLILTNISDELIVHPFTLTGNSNDRLVVDSSFFQREIHFYNRIDIDNNKVDIIKDKLITELKNYKSTDINKEIIDKIKTYKGNKRYKILINDLVSSYLDELENVLNKILTDEKINIPIVNGNQETENYTKERLLLYLKRCYTKTGENYCEDKIADLTEDNITNAFKSAFKSELNHANKLKDNNIFDFDLVNKYRDGVKIDDANTRNKLSNMLQRFTNIDSGILNSIRNNEVIEGDHIKTELDKVLKQENKIFKQNKMNEISFVSTKEEDKTLQTKLKYFNRSMYHSGKTGNSGYITDTEYDVMVKSGFYFADGTKDNTIFIPQEKNINIIDPSDSSPFYYYTVNGYCYDENNPTSTNIYKQDKYKLNNHAIGKYLFPQENSENKNIMEEFVHILTNNQLNPNLSSQLEELCTTLSNTNDIKTYLGPNNEKFKNPNHWRDDIFIHNSFDIFDSAFNDYNRLSNLETTLKTLKEKYSEGMKKDEAFKALGITPESLAENLSDEYIIQLKIPRSRDERLKKGYTLQNPHNSDASDPYNKVKNMVIKKIVREQNDQKKTIESVKNVNKRINSVLDHITKYKEKAYKVLENSMKLIDLIDGTTHSVNQNDSEKDRAASLNTHINSIKGSNPSKSVEIYNLKNRYNHNYIRFFDGFISGDVNKNIYSFEEITSEGLNTMKVNQDNNNGKNSRQYLSLNFVKAYNIKSILQQMFTFNKDGTANGVSTDYAHIEREKNTLILQKNINNKLKMYGENFKVPDIKTVSVDVSTYYDIKTSLLNTIKVLKDKDPNILLPNKNEKFILEPSKLYRDARSITQILELLVEIYDRNKDSLTKEESEEFIFNIHYTLNGFKYYYYSADINDEKLYELSIFNINEEKINDMEIIVDKAISIHNDKFNTDQSNQNIKFELLKFEPKYNSKYTLDKINHIIESFNDLISEDDNDNDFSMRFDFDKNNKVVNIERKSEIDKLIEDFKNIEIYENISKEYKGKLISLYNDLNELEDIFDIENEKASKKSKVRYMNNSYAVYNLKFALVEMLDKYYSSDDDIKKLISEHNSKPTKNFDKKTLTSDNQISLDFLINNVEDADKYIINDINSEQYVKKYFDSLKAQVKDEYANSNKIDNSINKINNIKSEIDNKISNFNKYTSPEGHYEEADHLISLINHYNELINVAKENCSDGELSKLNGIYIENNNELYNRLNYIRLKLMYKSLDKIIKSSNNNRFNNVIARRYSIADYVNIQNEKNSEAIWYKFNGYEISEPVNNDFKSIINDVINTESDALIIFDDESTGKHQVLELKRSHKLKYKLITHAPSFYRDSDEIESLNRLINKDEFYKSINSKSMKRLETFNQAEERLDASTKLTIDEANQKGITNINTDDNHNIYSSLDKAVNDDNSLLNNEEIKKSTKATKKKYSYIKKETIKISDRVTDDIFKVVSQKYNSFIGSCKTSLSTAKLIDISEVNKVESKASSINNNTKSKIKSDNKYVNQPPKIKGPHSISTKNKRIYRFNIY